MKEMICILNFSWNPSKAEPFRRAGFRYRDNLKKKLGEVGYAVVNWIYLVDDEY
jgi:hypothetical protein